MLLLKIAKWCGSTMVLPIDRDPIYKQSRYNGYVYFWVLFYVNQNVWKMKKVCSLDMAINAWNESCGVCFLWACPISEDIYSFILWFYECWRPLQWV